MKLKKILLGILLSFSMTFALSISDLNEIRGDNPTPYELNSYILEKCKDNNIPPIIMKAILLQEGASNNKWKQFYDSGVIVSGDDGDGNSYGLGLFQITRKLNTANESEVRKFVKYWKNNVDKAVATLLIKWQSNIGGMTGVDTDPLIIENWYYPIAWYNGEGIPARNYVKKIYGFMKNESKVESMLYGSDNYNTILNYYKTISNIALPDIIDSFRREAILANHPQPYTLKQIVDYGGEIHRWNKSSNTYEVYNISNHNSSSTVTSRGYYAPYKAGTSKRVSQGYDGTVSHYGSGTGSSSAYAIDFAGKFDVYAPKDGIVATKGTNSYKIPYCVKNPQHWHGPANYLSIKHNDGRYTYYFHLGSINVNIGDKVIQGRTILGVSGNTGCSTSNHLHFQFAKKASMSRKNSLKISFADIGIPKKGKSYTSKNTPRSNSSENSSIFDGAGSLVSPNEDGAGASYDIAKMHPHDGENSTVVFQWLYDKNSCSQLDITSEESIGDVIIRSKKWNGHLTKEEIKVRLDSFTPITIKRPDSNKNWTTFSVTTTNPLTSSNKIYAECKSSSDRFKTGHRSTISNKDLLNVTHNRFWTGTGSIISFATERGSNQFGIDKDYAVTFKTEKSLTSFQWYSSSSCPKLKIRNARSSTINSPITSIHIKGWADESWGSNQCGSTLPCTLDAPDGEGSYYVVKVKSDADAIRFGTLKAECVQ